MGFCCASGMPVTSTSRWAGSRFAEAAHDAPCSTARRVAVDALRSSRSDSRSARGCAAPRRPRSSARRAWPASPSSSASVTTSSISVKPRWRVAWCRPKFTPVKVPPVARQAQCRPGLGAAGASARPGWMDRSPPPGAGLGHRCGVSLTPPTITHPVPTFQCRSPAPPDPVHQRALRGAGCPALRRGRCGAGGPVPRGCRPRMLLPPAPAGLRPGGGCGLPQYRHPGASAGISAHVAGLGRADRSSRGGFSRTTDSVPDQTSPLRFLRQGLRPHDARRDRQHDLALGRVAPGGGNSLPAIRHLASPHLARGAAVLVVDQAGQHLRLAVAQAQRSALRVPIW